MPKMCFTADAGSIEKIKSYCKTAGITHSHFLRELTEAFLAGRRPSFKLDTVKKSPPPPLPTSGGTLRF